MDRTITAGQRATPLEIGLTLKGLVVTEGVSCFATERHQCPHIEIIAVPLTIDWDTRINAVVRLELQDLNIK